MNKEVRELLERILYFGNLPESLYLETSLILNKYERSCSDGNCE